MSPLVRVSDVEVREVEYLVAPFVPFGKLTDLAGQMGQGKSLFLLLLAKLVTRAREPGSVIIFAAEDDIGDTIRPRLEAVGADVNRVHVESEDALDSELIDAYCDGLGDVRLVGVDPLTGFFPKGVDAWKTPDVRRFLKPYLEVAQRQRFALVGVQHVNRRTDSDPLSRIADAQGIPQVARSVLIWGPDPDDEDGDGGSRKVLATAKNNLSAGKPSAGFIIESKTLDSGISAPMLRHLGESQAEAVDLVTDQEARSQTQDAIVWLRDLLEDGALEVELVKKTAADVGISTKCLRTARERIATHSRPGGNQGPYVWTLKPAYRKKPASMGNHNSGGGNHEGNHQSVNAWMPMDAHVPTLTAVVSDAA